MSTIRASNQRDPPETTSQVVGFKRIRKLQTLTAGAGNITVGDLASCLPFQTNNSEFRIMKFSIWGPDVFSPAATAGSSELTLVFPVSNPPTTGFNGTPGDNSVWVDQGTSGQTRAQIHLTPAFEYRNYWLGPLKNGTGAIIATFTAAAQVIIDITIQYRTVTQACPALEYLHQLRRDNDSDSSWVEVLDESPASPPTEVATHLNGAP